MSDETVRLELPEEHALVRQFQIRVIEEDGPGATFESKGPRTVIGKERSADLVLAEPTVSRFHCEIRVEGERIVIQDLNSLNGTYVNGTRVLAAYLADEASITLGRCQLQFQRSGAELKVPLLRTSIFGSMVGESEIMRAVFAALSRIAMSDATLLLSGERGTGKDLAAESVHQVSARREGPFVVVDCGNVLADFMEKELFGYQEEEADTAHPGAFERASGGTLFLDDVGKLSLDVQPKLLYALEHGEIRRVGSKTKVPIDVRIVAAANGNLREDVNGRAFRSDLYFRLAEAEVELPPLRERKDDIPLLVTRILDELGGESSPYLAEIRSEAFLDELSRPAWPGNVRELRDHIERCLLVGAGDTAAEGVEDEPLSVLRSRLVDQFERRYLEALLDDTSHDVQAAAKRAGLNRAAFTRLLSRHRLT